MNNALEYRGYTSTVEFSAEDRCFHGKIAGIRDLVAYDGTTKIATVDRDWGTHPDATTTFPQQMVVDYVRVYK